MIIIQYLYIRFPVAATVGIGFDVNKRRRRRRRSTSSSDHRKLAFLLAPPITDAIVVNDHNVIVVVVVTGGGGGVVVTAARLRILGDDEVFFLEHLLGRAGARLLLRHHLSPRRAPADAVTLPAAARLLQKQQP